MIKLDQVRPLDAPELHPVGISLAVGRAHIEPPFAADANIYRLRLNVKPGRAEPLGEVAWISPRGEYQLSRRIDYARENDFSIERPTGQK